MISFSAGELLLALYFEQVSTGKGKVPFKILEDSYGFGNLQDRLVNGLLDHGLAEPAVYDEDAESTAITLTATGLRHARDLATAGFKAKKFPELSDKTTSSDGTRFSWKVPPDDFEHLRFDDDPIVSSTWTGLPSNFSLSEQKAERLLVLLNDVDEQISTLQISNSDKSQVRALVLASRILAEAPEPPADLIWELVNRASQVAGVAALFVAIIGLFK